MSAVLLAHEGGWDEILLVAGPIIVIAGLLWVATRRARRLHPTATTPAPDPAVGGDDDDPRSQAGDGPLRSE